MKPPAIKVPDVEAIARAFGPAPDGPRKISIRARTVDANIFTGRVAASDLEVVVDEGKSNDDGQ